MLINEKGIYMIQKIMPEARIIRKNLVRTNLQRTTHLKNLNTRMIRQTDSMHDMIIPGGMTQKEELVHALTGKFPKSVTDRWYEAHGVKSKNLTAGDELVHVDSKVLGDTGYVTDSGSTYAGSGDDHDEGLFSKLLNHIFGND